MSHTLQFSAIIVLIVIISNLGYFNFDLIPSVNGQFVEILPELEIAPIASIFITTPILLSPPNGSFLPSSTGVFDWTDAVSKSGIKSYQFQLSTTESFKSMIYNLKILSASTSTSTFVLPPPSNFSVKSPLSDGTYYWRVFAVDGAGSTSATSSVFSFTIDTTPPKPPTLLSPSNGSTTKDATPSFDWTDVTDSSGITYRIDIASDPEFSRTSLFVSSSPSASLYTSPKPISDGTYYWRVFAVDGAGNTSATSSVFRYSISTIQPNIPPVAIISSSDNYEINNNIRFSGIDSYDPDGDIVRYDWIIDGKNNPNDSSVITKIFQSSGNHKIILIVYDNHDAVGKTTRSITVNDKDEIPWIPIVGAVAAVGVVGAIAAVKFSSSASAKTGKKYIKPKPNAANFEVEIKVGLE